MFNVKVSDDLLAQPGRLGDEVRALLALPRKEPQYNLYAKISGNGTVAEIIMPTDEGVLPPAPAGEGWYFVAWPVNPHFTGRSCICAMIEATWPYRKPGLARRLTAE